MTIPAYFDLLGRPFERGGRGPKTYDCYGLVIEMFKRRGITLPDFESPGSLEEIEELMADKLKRWRRVEFGTPMSLITFRADGMEAHVGFMLKDDRFLHAIDGAGVTTERLSAGLIKPLGFYEYG